MEARHKTLSTHKHVQHSTQVQAQSASILWAVLHISLLHSSFPSPESFLGYFNRTSFGFLVSGSLLHVTTYSSSVGRNLVLDRFFHFIVPIFPDFPSLARNHANFEHSSVEEFFLLRLLLKTFPNGNNNNKNTALLNHVSYCMVLV
uniref:(northern house mosquito) hypothetical protein n=1 Tax=Culex pipiens TaxID=7175 RepID=A0A8D8AR62_CULPI